jgi:signal transduction histidine kinase
MKGVGIVIEIEPSISEKIYTDQKRLRQILFNLIGNAVKFTTRGNIVIRVSRIMTFDLFGS